MKLKTPLFIILIILLYSCSPKIAPTVTPKSTIPFKMIALNPNQYQGKTLFEANCANCHKLYAPNEFSKEAWKPILKRMQANTDLNDAQTEQVYDYITSGL